MSKKRIAIFGSTGSIGTQALEVIRQHPTLLEATVLVAKSNYQLLIQQAIEFLPDIVVIIDEQHYPQVKEALAPHPIKVFVGEKSAEEVAMMDVYDMMLSAIVGFAGVRSTLAAAQMSKSIALANKESMVVAGNLITRSARQTGAKIVPVDSEHVAIDQCLDSGMPSEVKRIILTASGGAFRNQPKSFIARATYKDALKHPTWAMGAKITIDSASLMNKGLEMIEAKWLFQLDPSQIDAVIHPQSIIHSMVEYVDGQFMAQLGMPDMKMPIAYAFFYPNRIATAWSKFDPLRIGTLTFEEIDEDKFPALTLAKQAMYEGGIKPCILNAANEVAVQFFLDEKISFYQMADVVAKALAHLPNKENPEMTDYLEYDRETRNFVGSLVK